MKKLRYILSPLFCTLVIIGTVACHHKEDIIPEVDTPEDQTEVWTIKVSASKAGDDTKALYLDGNALKTKWTQNEKVLVFTESNGKWYRKGTLNATPNASNNHRATLSGAFTNLTGVTVGRKLQFLFPRDTFNYTDQLGTLEYISNRFDFAKAEAAVISVDSQTKIIETEPASFVNQQSIFLFKFKCGGSDVKVKHLKISAANDKLLCYLDYTNNIKYFGDVTVSPLISTSELYVAMRNEYIGNDTYTFTVIGHNNKVYSATKSGNLANGKYYTSTISLTEQSYLMVKNKKDVTTTSWNNNPAYMVRTISGYSPSSPGVDNTFRGWNGKMFSGTYQAFGVVEDGGRWWFVTPSRMAFLSIGVCEVDPGSSTRQKANISSRYGSNSKWAAETRTLLLENNFNTLGAWSNSAIVTMSNIIPFTYIISPMGEYNKYLKSSGREAEAYAGAKSWEGYPYDFAMVFDDDFDTFIDSEVEKVAQFANLSTTKNKFLIGYFIDNELPWKNYALDNCLTKWPADHINHIKAQEWLDARKGITGATMASVTDADRKAFIAYCYETYLQKVIPKLKAKDPNHLILGNRFNQWSHELVNEEMFSVAGNYLDVISINYYHNWQPDQTAMNNWVTWSGKPFLVTEFYVKGVDTGLPNTEGAGFLVKSQFDRGVFYQNFVIELLKNKGCVGWHWFSYMDNDPTNTTLNLDSNKGIVKWNTQPYNTVLSIMKEVNQNAYPLATFFNP